jgi:phosphopantothenoylcysteine synthetase/decarboxylase
VECRFQLETRSDTLLTMRCLVTAGPTYEALDRVRRLTNFSTGSLGTDLANHLAAAGHDVLILRGEQASSPPPVQAVAVEMFTSTSDLAGRFLTHSTGGPMAIFHTAAVSDFTFGLVYERGAEGDLTPVYQGKISTRNRVLLAELKPTPKILPHLREWYPAAIIVGWKYEVDGTRERATTRAREQVSECHSNACVVNGPAYGDGFGLVRADGSDAHVVSRHELFDQLLMLMTA